MTSEQLDGATVYHVVATADTTKIMDDIVKALEQSGLLQGEPAAAPPC